jgi:hypothetical protein
MQAWQAALGGEARGLLVSGPHPPLVHAIGGHPDAHFFVEQFVHEA